MLRGYAVVQLLVQHVGNYADLGTAAAAEYRDTLARRVLLAVVAAVAGVTGLAALWATGLAAVWNTPWRVLYLGVSAALLIAVALWALGGALSTKADGPSVRLLKAELRKDLELFEQWKSTQQ